MPTEPAVAVVGNVCWDVVVRGLPALPRWGEEVEGDDNAQGPGGQAYNMAAALAVLGVPTVLVGCVGEDAAGGQTLAAGRALGVDCAGVTVDARLPTALTAALVRPDGERAFASDFGCQRAWGLARILERWDTIAPASVLGLMGLFNLPGLPLADARTLFERARAAGMVTVLDTGWDPLGWTAARRAETLALLSVVDVFLPNLDEARALTGRHEPADVVQALHERGPGTLVVKCGGDGSLAAEGDERRAARALDVTVRDAVGAGDTFAAGFVAGVLEDRDLDGRLALATAAGALRVSRAGDAWPARGDVDGLAAAVRVEAWG